MSLRTTTPTWTDTITINLLHGLEYLKYSIEVLVASGFNLFQHTNFSLDTRSVPLLINGTAQEIFKTLPKGGKDITFWHVYQIAKAEDPTISGEKWGEENALTDEPRLERALRRAGFLKNEATYSIHVIDPTFGEGGVIQAQNFSLSEKLGIEPETGRIGYINGMGVPTLELAGTDTARLSDMFASGNNIHVVYNPTHQRVPHGDFIGFLGDLMRLLASNGGAYTRTSLLLAQQWIDFLHENPTKNFLQISHSEGTVHTNAALRIIREKAPDLLPRICILAFCPAYNMLPENYAPKDRPELKPQIMNFVKIEDTVIYPLGRNADRIGSSEHIHKIEHTNKTDHPHNMLTKDYQDASREYFTRFFTSGKIY